MDLNSTVTKAMDYIGDQVGNFTSTKMDNLLIKLGINQANLGTKIGLIVIALVGIYFALNISKKIVKVLIILGIIAFIGTMGISIFS